MRKMHKLIPAAALALAAAEVSAQLVYEPFDYSTTNAIGNANITNSLANGGNSASFGRTNQGQGVFWTRTGAGAADHTITTGSLTAPSSLPDATGNKAEFANTSNVDRIGFGQIVTSGRIYYSLLLKFDTLPAASSRILGFNTFSLDAPGAATVLGSAVTTRAQSGGWQVGVAKNSAAAQFDSRIWSTSDTLFLVGAYEINGGVGNDDVGYMWVNPASADHGQDFGADPGPVTDRLTDAGTAADLHDAVGGGSSPLRAPSVASFLLRANTSNSQWRVDEVRVDTTWAGVTPRKDLQYAWNSTGGGTFADSSKWTSNAGAPNPNPNSLGAVANFGPAITGPATITTAGETVDTVHIDNANSVTIAGTGLTISTNASAGQLIARQGSHTISAPLTLSDDLAIKVGADPTGANGATLTLSGNVTAAGRTIGKYGLGTLKLGASNIIDDTATLAVRVGTLDLNGNSETVGTVIVGAGHRNTGADLFTTANVAPGAITGSGTLSATTVQLENGSVSASLGGTTAVLKTTQGTGRLSGLSSYSGDTTIRAGTLLVGADAPHGAPGALGNSTNPVKLSDALTIVGTIDPGAAPKSGDPVSLLTDAAVNVGRNILVGVEGYPTIGGNSAHLSTFSGGITLNRATNLSAAAGGTVSFTGVISEATAGATITKLGGGTVILAGANSYTGSTTVNAGALVANNTGALPGWNVGGTVVANSTGTAAVSAGGAGQWLTSDIDTFQTTVTFNAGSSFGINVDTPNTFSYSNIVNAAGFTKLGGGTLILSGTNNQTSNSIAGGNLRVSSDADLGAVPGVPTANITLSNGGALQFGATMDIHNNRTIVVASSGGVIDTNGNSTIGGFGGTIDGLGALTKRGSGTFHFAGNATYNGLVLEGGVFSVFSDANLGTASGPITFNGGELKVFSSFSNAGRHVTVNAGGGTMNTNGFDVQFGNVSGPGTLNKTTGKFTVNHVRTGGLNVNAGTVEIALQANPYDASSAAGVSNIGALIIASGALLNIQNNKLITGSDVGSWNGSAYSGITGLVQSGRGTSFVSGSDPLWDGTTGIITSQSDATDGILHTIGVASAEDVLGIDATASGVWAGQTVSGDSTLVMYTWGGDIDLDGDVDGDDYFNIDSNVADSNAHGYFKGDIDYNGEIDGDDYFIIDSNIAVAQSSGNVFYTSSGAGGGLTAVPEPGSLSVVAIGACAFARRRRRLG